MIPNLTSKIRTTTISKITTYLYFKVSIRNFEFRVIMFVTFPIVRFKKHNANSIRT